MKKLQGPIYQRSDHAGFIRRTLALAIDLLILVLIYAVGVELFMAYAPASWMTLEGEQGFELAWLLCSLAYLVGFRTTDKGTPGYRLMGIRYASMFDATPSILMRLYRAVMAVFLLWFFALDHIWILFDPCKQAWHDKVTGFYVVKTKAKPQGTQRIVQRIVNFMMLSFVVWEPATEVPRP